MSDDDMQIPEVDRRTQLAIDGEDRTAAADLWAMIADGKDTPDTRAFLHAVAVDMVEANKQKKDTGLRVKVFQAARLTGRPEKYPGLAELVEMQVMLNQFSDLDAEVANGIRDTSWVREAARQEGIELPPGEAGDRAIRDAVRQRTRKLKEQAEQMKSAWDGGSFKW